MRYSEYLGRDDVLASFSITLVTLMKDYLVGLLQKITSVANSFTMQLDVNTFDVPVNFCSPI